MTIIIISNSGMVSLIIGSIGLLAFVCLHAFEIVFFQLMMLKVSSVRVRGDMRKACFSEQLTTNDMELDISLVLYVDAHVNL